MSGKNNGNANTVYVYRRGLIWREQSIGVRFFGEPMRYVDPQVELLSIGKVLSRHYSIVSFARGMAATGKNVIMDEKVAGRPHVIYPITEGEVVYDYYVFGILYALGKWRGINRRLVQSKPMSDVEMEQLFEHL